MGATWSAPVRNLFNRGKVKEEVQQGVEVVVNAAEQGLQRLDVATSGAVTNLADELSNAGVDLSQFKNNLVHAIDDEHRVDNEVGTSAMNVAASVKNGLKDEFHHVETQTEVGIEKAGAKIEKTVENTTQKLGQAQEEAVAEIHGAAKKAEDAVVETVSSLTSEMASFGETAGAKVANGLKTVEDTAISGVQGAKEAEKKVEDIASKTEETVSGWTTSLLTKEKQLADEAKQAVSQKKEEVSSGIETGVKVAEETASAGVEKATQGLSSLQESLDAKKEEISSGVEEVVDKVTEGLDNLKKGAEDKKNEVASGLSSDLHFLRDTVVASKDIVVETFNIGRNEEKDSPKASPPEFQSTQQQISSSDNQEEKSANATEKSKVNGTNNEEVEMGDKEDKKETSPIKEVNDFLKSEISDASTHIEAKIEEVKEGVTNGASAAASEAQNSLFDSLTNIGSSITNTLHNIESDIEYTGQSILTGVGTKVKEAGDFIAGTEEEIDQNMDDKELKTEAVTSLLDKSLLN